MAQTVFVLLCGQERSAIVKDTPLEGSSGILSSAKGLHVHVSVSSFSAVLIFILICLAYIQHAQTGIFNMHTDNLLAFTVSQGADVYLGYR